MHVSTGKDKWRSVTTLVEIAVANSVSQELGDILGKPWDIAGTKITTKIHHALDNVLVLRRDGLREEQ